MESGYASNDSDNHEEQGNYGPNDTPALRRTAIALGENACIGTVDFTENQIVTLNDHVSKEFDRCPERVNLQYPRRYKETT
jgi:hypothetical protein